MRNICYQVPEAIHVNNYAPNQKVRLFNSMERKQLHLLQGRPDISQGEPTGQTSGGRCKEIPAIKGRAPRRQHAVFMGYQAYIIVTVPLNKECEKAVVRAHKESSQRGDHYGLPLGSDPRIDNHQMYRSGRKKGNAGQEKERRLRNIMTGDGMG